MARVFGGGVSSESGGASCVLVAPRYRIDGEDLLSVTQIIELAGLSTDYGALGVAPEVLERAGRRGTAVHELISNYLRDCKPFWRDGKAPPREPLPAGEYAGGVELYFDPWQKWADAQRPLAHATERVVSVKGRFAGTLDFVGWLGGEWMFLDWKTREARPYDFVQLAGYRFAYAAAVLGGENEGYFAKSKLGVVEVRRGAPPVVRTIGAAGEKSATRAFLAALALVEWKIEQGLIVVEKGEWDGTSEQQGDGEGNGNGYDVFGEEAEEGEG